MVLNRQNGQRLALFFLFAALIGVLVWAFVFIRHRMNYAVTNAVFVETNNIINLGFNRVSGRLLYLSKEEGDPVKKGEILAEIDPKDYQLRVERLSRELKALEKERSQKVIALNRLTKEVSLKEAMARAGLMSLKERLSAIRSRIEGLSAVVKQLTRDRDRFVSLYQSRVVSKRRLEDIQTRLAQQEAERKALLARERALLAEIRAAEDKIRLTQAEKARVEEGRKALAALDERLASLRAQLLEAQRLVAYCRLKSPISGRVAKKYASAGDVLRPGAPVYALVNPRDVYILVLLEENKLQGIKIGAPARITIDAFPREVFQGVVSEILPTSAAKFALVPRDISAGEFTKVAQRIPIKIKITKGPVELLRIGLGGEVEIKRQP